MDVVKGWLDGVVKGRFDSVVEGWWGVVVEGWCSGRVVFTLKKPLG